jgi:hypothetical protein
LFVPGISGTNHIKKTRGCNSIPFFSAGTSSPSLEVVKLEALLAMRFHMENIDTLTRCGIVRHAAQSLKLVSGSLVLVLSASLLPRPAAASLLVD